MTTLLVSTVLVFLLIVVLGFAFTGDNSASMSRRLARVKGEVPKTDDSKKMADKLRSVLRDQKDSDIAAFDHLIKSVLPQPDKLRARLERTGKKISIGTYILMNALTGVVLFLVFTQMGGAKPLQAALFSVAGGLFLPHAMIGRMGNKRVANFLKYFPEAIDTMVRGLRSGLPVSESINAVAREMPDPVGAEFSKIADAIRLGQGMDDAMWDVARRIDTPEFRFMIIAMSIQRETGGNLGETLGNLAELIRKRRALRLKIRALSSEARASAMIIGSLPFFMFAILYLLNREYANVLLYTPGGNQLLTVAGVMMAIGHGTMSRMIKFEI